MILIPGDPFTKELFDRDQLLFYDFVFGRRIRLPRKIKKSAKKQELDLRRVTADWITRKLSHRDVKYCHCDGIKF